VELSVVRLVIKQHGTIYFLISLLFFREIYIYFIPRLQGGSDAHQSVSNRASEITAEEISGI
jgi:hypothetical protein